MCPRNLNKIYIIKTLETWKKTTIHKVNFKLEKELNYFKNVKFIMIPFESYSLFFGKTLMLISLSYIFLEFFELILNL